MNEGKEHRDKYSGCLQSHEHEGIGEIWGYITIVGLGMGFLPFAYELGFPHPPKQMLRHF